jgi:hypothetical protein
MFEQTLIDALVVLGLFVLRVGVPVAVLFGLATWVERKLRSQETQATEQRASSARIIPFVKTRQSAATPRTTARADEQTIAKRPSAK